MFNSFCIIYETLNLLNVPRCSILLIIAAVSHWDTNSTAPCEWPVWKDYEVYCLQDSYNYIISNRYLWLWKFPLCESLSVLVELRCCSLTVMCLCVQISGVLCHVVFCCHPHRQQMHATHAWGPADPDPWDTQTCYGRAADPLHTIVSVNPFIEHIC